MPTDRDIWTRVEELREQFPSLRADHLPLDLITFVELDLVLLCILFYTKLSSTV